MIKLCGVRREEDIEFMNEFKPDYVGFILADGFRRTIPIDKADKLSKGLLPVIKRVGVFVDTPLDKVKEAVDLGVIDVVQLHGNEDADYIKRVREFGLPIWKAVRVKSEKDIINADGLECDALLLDSFVEGVAGGTGKVADWNIIKNANVKSTFFLAGGLNLSNLEDALKISNNVDISGGIETDGIKDKEKIREIMKIYKGALKDE